MSLSEPFQIGRQLIAVAFPGDLAIGKEPCGGITQGGLQPLLDVRLL